MYDDVNDFDRALEHIAGVIDQVRGKLGDRFLRIELADHLAPKSTPFRVPSGLGEAIDKRIAPAGMDALQLFRALRDVNKDVPDDPDKIDTMVAAIGKLKKSMVPLSAEVAIRIGFKVGAPGSVVIVVVRRAGRTEPHSPATGRRGDLPRCRGRQECQAHL